MLEQKEIRFWDYVKIVWQQRYACCLIVLGITLGAIAYSYTLPNRYRAEAIILPLSVGSSSSTVSGLLSTLPFIGGAGGAADASNLLHVYLTSKALKIRLIRSLDLLPQFFPSRDTDPKGTLTEEQKLDMASGSLDGMLIIEHDRLIREKLTLSAVAEDPVFAAKLLRQWLVELQNFISTNVLTQAKRHRLFLEEQLAKNKKEILEMGKAMASFYVQNPVSTARAKLNVPVAVSEKEGVRNFKNYEEFQQYFDVLQREQNQEEGTIQSVKDVPHQVYLNYLSTQQAVIENNFATLSQAYEGAKLEETKQEIAFQILAEPVVPRFRFSPNRRGIAKNAFVVSLLVCLLYILCKEFFIPQQRLKSIQSREALVAEEVA